MKYLYLLLRKPGIMFIAFSIISFTAMLFVADHLKPNSETLIGNWYMREADGGQNNRVYVIKFRAQNWVSICKDNVDRRNCNSYIYESSDGGFFNKKMRILIESGTANVSLLARYDMSGNLILSIEDRSQSSNIHSVFDYFYYHSLWERA